MASMLSRVTVEAFYAPADQPGRFQLDSTILGHVARPLADSSGEAWTSLTDDIRSLSITRGTAPEKLTASPDVGTATITLVNVTAHDIRPATPIRITGDGSRLFTGQVFDIRDTEIRKGSAKTPYTITTITATDRVADIANTMRYGAYLTPPDEMPWYGFETAAERFTRYLRSTGWQWNGPETLVSTWASLTNFSIGTSQGSLTHHKPTTTAPAILNYHMFTDPQGSGFELRGVFASLPASTPLTVTAWARSTGADPVPDINNIPLDASGGWTLLTLHDQITSPAGILTITLHPTRTGENSIVEVAGVTLHRGCPSVEVQNIVYESSLANHLDLTANTTKGAWWVDKYNVIQVRTCSHTPANDRPYFTDGTIPPIDAIKYNAPISYTAPVPYIGGRPATASYVDLELSYDTANIVNDLTFANHGRAWDEESAAYVADDKCLDAGTNPTSVITYGSRSETLDTAFPVTTPALEGILTALPAQIGEQYLQESALPARAPRYMRIYHDPNRDPLPALDLREGFDLTRLGRTYTCTITGIKHDITPDHWHTDYHVIPKKAG